MCVCVCARVRVCECVHVHVHVSVSICLPVCPPQLCEDYLVETLDSNNACDRIQAAQTYRLDDLKRKTLEYIENNTKVTRLWGGGGGGGGMWRKAVGESEWGEWG